MLPTDTFSFRLNLRTIDLDRSSSILGSSSLSTACSSMDGMSSIVVLTCPRADEIDKLREGARDFSVDVACKTSKRKVLRSANWSSEGSRPYQARLPGASVSGTYIEKSKVTVHLAHQQTRALIRQQSLTSATFNAHRDIPLQPAPSVNPHPPP